MGVITHANPEPAVRERVPAELPRLLYILRALAGAGWAHYVERLRIGRDALEASVEAVQATDQDAKRLRATLEGLGPAFVKFGQLLSLRRDMLPEVYIEELPVSDGLEMLDLSGPVLEALKQDMIEHVIPGGAMVGTRRMLGDILDELARLPGPRAQTANRK